MKWIGLLPGDVRRHLMARKLFTVAPPELTIEIAIDTIATAQLTSAQLLFAQASSWLYFQRRAHTNEIDLMSISEMVLAPPLGNAVFS